MNRPMNPRLLLALLTLPWLPGGAGAAGTDLALTLDAIPNPVAVGENLTYALTVANPGPKAALGVVLTDTLPAGAVFKSASPGCRFASPKARRQNRITCKLKRLRPGASASWSILVTPRAEGGLDSSASVKSAKRDPNPANNSANASVVVATANRAPTAHALGQTADPALPYLQVQLSGSDPDNDTLSYELTAPAQGTGYTSAYVDSKSGLLYVAFAAGFQGTLALSYRVSDGRLFSPEAEVQIQVQPDNGDKGTGGQTIDGKTYSGYGRSQLSGDLLGSAGAAPTEPPSVDLSPSFPVPGDQGQQGSCVAWAVAYALKSYQEEVELGWSLDTVAHLFSPAYLYNQINGGEDNGSQIYDALDVVIGQGPAAGKGAATLATMPYSDRDYWTQPDLAAIEEGAKFKGLDYKRVEDLQGLKAALAQRRPVVLGIKVYDQFYHLQGTDSVYNSDAGSNNGPHGLHAVTAVGYDNNRYGGAIKVINSWGTGWGDKGFFWMPYDFIRDKGIIFQMWVMDDAPDGDITPTPDPVPPPPASELADLQINSWDVRVTGYTLGGSGELEWEVSNGGQATVAEGAANVSLMLSKDRVINASDLYLVYEPIPFDLKTGESAYRNIAEGNGIEFQFPTGIEPGDYYLALLLDDLNDIPESNESNNVSISEQSIPLTNSLSDLYIGNWYTYWDSTGEGYLSYDIYNYGAQAAPGGWTVKLELIDFSGNYWVVANDTISQGLAPNQAVSRDDFSNPPPLPFNVNYDEDSNKIPVGIYYVALSVDEENMVQESDEDNFSYYWDYAYLPTDWFASAKPATQAQAASGALSATASTGTATQAFQNGQAAYNGKRLPGQVAQLRKVRIGQTLGGQRTMEFIDEGLNVGTASASKAEHTYTKRIRGANAAIFPITQAKPMP
ncbi:CARDB domain-containing protein [Methylomagnum ishizawai]|uniref:CARDB domain-containing protein n=1 Tax=Methylomagnum ishizawai TaxID=1760988 RepID=UPI001C342AE3|nr:CARDB domain-containing protein [Methylomagnum ishizawai]BBL76677.1 hypothetical protein MishRS11D_37750 [Methylomagnum ishizawai]